MTSYDLAPLARFDLRTIWGFTVGRWGRRKANAYVSEVTAAIELLAADPGLGVDIDDVSPGLRKHPVHSHMIFYRLEGDRVIVVRVLHQNMDVDSHLS